jgi:hypothetical protein
MVGMWLELGAYPEELVELFMKKERARVIREVDAGTLVVRARRPRPKPTAEPSKGAALEGANEEVRKEIKEATGQEER